jgi:hypothetical protein
LNALSIQFIEFALEIIAEQSLEVADLFFGAAPVLRRKGIKCKNFYA